MEVYYKLMQKMKLKKKKNLDGQNDTKESFSIQI